MSEEKDGWHYITKPEPGTDGRKLVTLLDAGMVWVGIRYWNSVEERWYNGNEPERASVKAWRDLVTPAQGYWQRGLLHIPAPPPTGE